MLRRCLALLWRRGFKKFPNLISSFCRYRRCIARHRQRGGKITQPTWRICHCQCGVGYIFPFRDVTLLYRRIYSQCRRRILRDNVRIQQYRCHYLEQYRINASRNPILACNDAMDRWFGNCILHHCRSTDFRCGRYPGICSGSQRTNAWQSASSYWCHRQMDMGNLCRNDGNSDYITDSGRHEHIWQCMSCFHNNQYRWLFHQTGQYRVLPFALYRLCNLYFHVPFRYQLYVATAHVQW